MATIYGQITVNQVDILEVSGDPSAATGTPAPLGSLATQADGGGLWRKFGPNDVDWLKGGDAAAGSDMTVCFGLAGSLDKVYLQVAGGSKVTSDISTVGFPRAVKIIGYFIDTSSSNSNTRTFNVRIREKSNLSVDKVTILKVSGSYFQYSYNAASPLTTFNAGQRMSIYIDQGSQTNHAKADDPKITFWFRWND